MSRFIYQAHLGQLLLALPAALLLWCIPSAIAASTAGMTENFTDHPNVEPDSPSIQGTVWLDTNQDGHRNENEPGVGRIIINLLDATHHTSLQDTTTDSNGIYTFTVPPGSYVIEFVAPINGLATQYQGLDQNQNSDVASPYGKRFGQTSPMTLDLGDRFTNVDTGLLPATIHDTVWLDLNGNRQHDEDEQGIAGVWVILLDGIGNPLQSTITDAQGAYRFTFPPNHTIYSLQFVNAFGDEITLAHPKEEKVTGEATNEVAGVEAWLQETAAIDRYIWQQTEPIALAYGQQYEDVNIGLQPAQLGGTVWHDLNGNAIREADELGLAGIQVVLFDLIAQNAIMTTTSDDDGSYRFMTAPGTYELHFKTSAGVFFSPQPQLSENNFDEASITGISDSDLDSDADRVADSIADSDVDPTTGQTAAFEITFGERKLDYDAAIYEGAVLGDRVWFDTDGNGLQDEDEAGIADVALYLYNSQSVVVATTHSDSQGFYRFGNLPPDHYYMTIDMSDEYLVSSQGQAQADRDNDLNMATQQTNFITLTSGSQYMSVDIGLTLAASLQSHVWFDDDRDGIREPDETGIAGVRITLYDQFNRFVTDTMTDGEGHYHFEGIHPGLHTLEFEHETGFDFADIARGDSPEHDSDVDPYTGRTVLFQLNAGEVSQRWGAGLIIPRNEIELFSFDAQVDDTNVLLHWRTSHAVAQTGFRIYRNNVPERQGAERVRASIEISEQHQQATPIYHYLMTEPIEGIFSTETYYWLIDVENGVEIAEHGPIQATGPSDALDQDQVLVFLPFINR